MATPSHGLATGDHRITDTRDPAVPWESDADAPTARAPWRRRFHLTFT